MTQLTGCQFSRRGSRFDEQNVDHAVALNAELTGSRLCWNAELPNPAFEVETRPWLRSASEEAT